MVAAPAIATALFHRARTGRGQRVTVPLYDAMYTAIGSLLVRRLDVPAAPRALSPAIGRFYQCSDGRWVNVHADYERALRPLLETLGHPEWYSQLTDAGLRVDDVARGKWEAKFAERWMDRTALEWEEIMARAGVPCIMCRTVEEWMDTAHALEWEEIMARAGVPCIMCRTVEEWMDTAHAQESGAVVTLADPVYGPMRQVGIQVRLSDTPGSVGGPSPALGQHTEAVISELQAP
jgi:crotonobetainyl-CoA:carnitine CoA-transferase CaiB-like acyl-CoA transferase